MDGPTLTLLIGFTTCLIGVFTFISGRMEKAERNGSMETKINQALEGIADIKEKLEKSSQEHHETSLLVQSHDEKIKTLFRQDEDLHNLIHEASCTREVLMELVHTLKDNKN